MREISGQAVESHKFRSSDILARSGGFWVYEYLFAKQDRANIDDHELVEFRKLAKAYAGLTERQIAALLAEGDFLEICHEQG